MKTLRNLEDDKEFLKMRSGLMLLRECSTLVVPFLVAFGDVIIAHAYHKLETGAEQFRIVLLLVGMIVSLVLGCQSLRPGLIPWILRVFCRTSGIMILAWVTVGAGFTHIFWLLRVPLLQGAALVAAVLIVTWLTAGEQRWRRVRPPLLLGAILFVASQLFLAKLYSKPLSWPDKNQITQSSTIVPKAMEGVAFVLLDELNARDGVMLVDVLRQAGLNVTWRGIEPVAYSTAQAIPQIWTGRPFHEAKPCSFTAICSDHEVLDFAKVRASRPDIDIVGFYHPYCAMQGLRTCTRIAQPLIFGDLTRWKCAIKRKFNLGDLSFCNRWLAEPWFQMRAELFHSLYDQPFWSQGGLLYAHLPLPHPPGNRIGGTLREHYQDNLKIAASLLRTLASRLRETGFRQARLVIFSDHPLRVSLHCAHSRYRQKNCEMDTGPQDTQVPLIVASVGTSAPDLTKITTNAQVFSLSRL